MALFPSRRCCLGQSEPKRNMAPKTVPPTQTPTPNCRATQTTPAWHLLQPGETGAIDMEFQKYKIQHPDGTWSKELPRIGRISVTNTQHEPILDVFAIFRNETHIKKCPQPARFGVTSKDLLLAHGGKDARTVERWAKTLLANRTVVLHGGKHDLQAFFYEQDAYTASEVVDTQVLYSRCQEDGTPGLVTLARDI
ncbi:hypothetical protein EJ03DRAFT_340081 [Teratosphaeria nubilosa]|uniref:Exonuclease domain-containing protein n=1 Tax=Teratosphaeria nubilosa TaxID=161662 RepID=A0A6G1KUH9_9PEZI|nr:hypothetical protein EJ03DRAFT_340081 [Teratosphaeria nubilosa]